MRKTLPKNFHLIIDGPDRIGKTTVCQVLSKKLGLRIIKMRDMPVYFKKNPEEASEIFNKLLIQFKDIPFILDRGYPSSIVYSEVYKRNYDLSYLKIIEEELKAKVIILQREEPRKIDRLVPKKIFKELNRIYSLKSWSYDWKIINVGDLKPEEIVNTILKFL